MRAIIERTIGSEVSRRMRIGSDEIVRRIPTGSNWQKIRIGLHYCFTDFNANVLGTPRFFIGVCTRYKTWGSYRAHAVGLATQDASWSRNAGPPVSYSITLQNATVVNQTEALSGTGLVTAASAAPATVRHYMSLDINKSTPSAVSFTLFRSTNGLSGNTDVSPALARDLMEMTIPTLGNYTRAATTGTVSINEALNGGLDCVNIAWSMTDPSLEIIEVMVSTFDTA